MGRGGTRLIHRHSPRPVLPSWGPSGELSSRSRCTPFLSRLGGVPALCCTRVPRTGSRRGPGSSEVPRPGEGEASCCTAAAGPAHEANYSGARAPRRVQERSAPAVPESRGQGADAWSGAAALRRRCPDAAPTLPASAADNPAPPPLLPGPLPEPALPSPPRRGRTHICTLACAHVQGSRHEHTHVAHTQVHTRVNKTAARGEVAAWSPWGKDPLLHRARSMISAQPSRGEQD